MANSYCDKSEIRSEILIQERMNDWQWNNTYFIVCSFLKKLSVFVSPILPRLCGTMSYLVASTCNSLVTMKLKCLKSRRPFIIRQVSKNVRFSQCKAQHLENVFVDSTDLIVLLVQLDRAVVWNSRSIKGGFGSFRG